MNTDILRNNSQEYRYELEIDGHTAFVEYTEPSDKLVYLIHTYVPQQLSGQGIGTRLVVAVLELMKKEGISIVPQCEFIAQYIFHNPQWEEIVIK